MTFAPYSWFEEWKDEKVTNRGADYKELKQTIINSIMEVVFQIFPKVKDRVRISNVFNIIKQHCCASPETFISILKKHLPPPIPPNRLSTSMQAHLSLISTTSQPLKERSMELITALLALLLKFVQQSELGHPSPISSSLVFLHRTPDDVKYI